MRGADLRGANLKGAKLKGANLVDACIEGAKHLQAGPHLQGALTDVRMWDGRRSASTATPSEDAPTFCSSICAQVTSPDIGLAVDDIPVSSASHSFPSSPASASDNISPSSLSKESDESAPSDNTCVVCMDKKAEFVCRLGHLSVCRACRRKLVFQKLAGSHKHWAGKIQRDLEARQLDRTAVACPICRVESCLALSTKFDGSVI